MSLAPSRDSAGLVHLSAPGRAHVPAKKRYRGRGDFVRLYLDSLYLDSRALGSPVRWEPGAATDPQSMLFPHLYGPLPVSAVIKVTGYRPGPDGTFPPAGSSG